MSFSLKISPAVHTTMMKVLQNQWIITFNKKTYNLPSYTSIVKIVLMVNQYHMTL